MELIKRGKASILNWVKKRKYDEVSSNDNPTNNGNDNLPISTTAKKSKHLDTNSPKSKDKDPYTFHETSVAQDETNYDVHLAELSPYERQRLKNIRKNQEIMVIL
jgi:hypothetical protein